MLELQSEFIGKGEVRGFLFKCLLMSDNAYLYSVTTEGGVHYEVFERKENKQFNCVSYPKSNSFGVWAFTTIDLEKALAKYEYFKAKEKKFLDEIDPELIDEDEPDDEEINDEI